ncbi:zf-HC2 domain-containing protein [Streptomyces olivoreticuli]|uniref:zf-HC2 domain-containing protein n=1 Tax=Streptomyces olivoreticuli TaxID=68246 RepID=UPI0026580811|nr:zf-HC2 domain-containing protein [Streptomyces olivoreticuli]WKK21634.1 zf-HC2 domain-containing protein [Streptomyces olivoreticuli]
MTRPAQHMDVGAYALGVLDEAEAARFEEHLADCPWCAAELDGMLGLTPLLAGLKESAPDPGALTARPRPALLDGLLARVAAVRHAQRTRRLCLAAAAAVLIVAGPLAGSALTSRNAPSHSSASAAQEMYEEGEKIGAVDPATKVDATVSLQEKPWGTHVALKLANVKGPLTCDLVAVGKNGERQTVTTWAVPAGGYGLAGTGSNNAGKASKWNKEPLYTHGGAGLNRNDIARFEVRTLDGKLLDAIEV